MATTTRGTVPGNRRSMAGTAALGLLAVLLAGCGGGAPAQQGQQNPPEGQQDAQGRQLPPPAEPAQSPEQTGQPAGRVVPVGPNPEGAVADGQTGLVVVALRDIGKLALVDGQTGRTVKQVDLPGRLRHLQLQKPGGPVLVPDEGADALLRVSLPDGRIVTRVPVGNFPHDAAATSDGSAFAVANEFAGTLSVIKDGEVVKTYDQATTPSGVAAVGDIVGMVDTRETSITFYDLANLERLGELPAGEGPTHVVSGPDGGYFVADTRGGAILVYVGASNPRMVGNLDLPGRPYGIAYDQGRDWLWVTLTAKNQLVGVDVSGNEPRVATRIPTIRQPNTVTVNSDTGRVFVTSPTENALELIDPAQAGAQPSR